MRNYRRFAVAACLLLVLAGCGKKATPTPTTPTPTPTTTTIPAQANRPPQISGATATPAFGVAGLTSIALAGFASDPDGDAISFSWVVPGGGALAGASVAVTAAGDGVVNAVLTVNDNRGGSESRNVPYTVGTMSGTWRLDEAVCGSHFMTLTQAVFGASARVTGTTAFPQTFCGGGAGSSGNTDPAAPGSITEAGAVTLRFKHSFFSDYNFTGNMSSTGRTATGVLNGSGFVNRPATLTKQ